MATKRRVLEALSREEMLDAGRALDVPVTARMSRDELLEAIVASRSAGVDRILTRLGRDRLKDLCEALGLSSVGAASLVLIERILGKGDKPPQSELFAPPKQVAPAEDVATGAQQTWVAYPVVDPSPPPPPSPKANEHLSVSLDVQARKPRLAWQGMERRESATAVPTQVVEIVWPGRAVHRQDELAMPRFAEARGETTTLPPNRLIWTNDNLVALQTLLDEKDPTTKGYRYRGRVDLVYIDPPFMVNSDFRADNAVEIELDEQEGVAATKEPSLVEILAYKDTWRQGLDTFLTMLRQRITLLKELLAPTASIYVHLDWHAVHYVKVLMDEIFGYENFINEVIWQRQTSHNDSGQGAMHFGRVHDSILIYRAGPSQHLSQVYAPYDASYVRSHYKNVDERGRRFMYDNLIAPGGASKGNPFYEVLGHKRFWRYSQERMQQLIAEGRVAQPSPGSVPRYKRFLDDMPGIPLQDVWTDLSPVNSQAVEALGYPTQKPISLLEKIVSASCPVGGIVLDCFAGSGTTCEAAERLGRRWIGVDNGKYAVHLARKRLIQLHGQPRPPGKTFSYVECAHCKTVDRKEAPKRSTETFDVHPFTVENMGVYQRAAEWQDFQTRRSVYRDEMIKVFGGEPINHSPLLHGRKGASWVHVGPLDGPVSSSQVWSIAREAQRSSIKAVTVLSADFDTLSGSDKEGIKAKTGVSITIRVIPASAIDEVRRRLELQKGDPTSVVESMAIPAFYAPLSIVLDGSAAGRKASVTLKRCEIDIDSFIASQRPVLKPVIDGMTSTQKKKAQEERKKWEARQAELEKWLAKANTWQKFIDFWAVDWDYGKRVSSDGKPIFETQWQSFRVRKNKDDVEPIMFVAEFIYKEAGSYRVAARVTDVFGNDGIATVQVEVR